MAFGFQCLQQGSSGRPFRDQGGAGLSTFEACQRIFELVTRKIVVAAINIALQRASIESALEGWAQVEERGDGTACGIRMASGPGQQSFTMKPIVVYVLSQNN